MNETRNWTWHIISAIVVLAFLGLHMLVMHLDDMAGYFATDGNAIGWTNVISRSKSYFFAATYVVLLAAALYHGLYGLRNILFELSIGKAWQKGINIFFWIAGLCLFGLGGYATMATCLI